MAFHSKFRNALQTSLLDSAELLFNASQAWMEEEIREGWSYFFANELWFMKNLPQPLINESGRQYEIEKLRLKIDKLECDPRFATAPSSAIDDYRNYLDPGPMDVYERDGRPGPRDLVANRVTEQLLKIYNRHFWFEARRNEQQWREEASGKAQFTVQFGERKRNKEASQIRNEALSLERDAMYWRALYQIEPRELRDFAFLQVASVTYKLMRLLAPSFAYQKINSNTSLVFTKVTGRVAWTILFQRMGGVAGSFHFPPQLVLLDAAVLETSGKGKKIAPNDVLFFDVVGVPRLPLYETQDLELCLRFSLQRFERAIAFYQPFVDQALHECA